jgi:hypothetical protein
VARGGPAGLGGRAPVAPPGCAAELAGRLDRIAARARSGARPPAPRHPGPVPSAPALREGAPGGGAAPAEQAGQESSPAALRPVAEAIAGVQALLTGPAP